MFNCSIVFLVFFSTTGFSNASRKEEVCDCRKWSEIIFAKPSSSRKEMMREWSFIKKLRDGLDGKIRIFYCGLTKNDTWNRGTSERDENNVTWLEGNFRGIC